MYFNTGLVNEFDNWPGFTPAKLPKRRKTT